MMNRRVSLFPLSILVLCVLAIGLPALGQTPPGVRTDSTPLISDFEARLTLARLLSYRDETLDESLSQYKILVTEAPGSVIVRLEKATVLARLKRLNEAAVQLDAALRENPDDPDILSFAADLEASLGHASRSVELYEKAISVSTDPNPLYLRFADAMTTWGDFYRAERIYRKYLENNPDDFSVKMRLGRVLAASQRYAESEGLFLKLLQTNSEKEAEIRLERARSMVARKDFHRGLQELGSLLEFLDRRDKIATGDDENIRLQTLKAKGDLLLRIGEHEKAFDAYERLSRSNRFAVEGSTGKGRALIASGRIEEAKIPLHSTLQLDPGHIEAAYYLEYPDRVITNGFIENLIKDTDKSAPSLVEWGRLYSGHGFHHPAIRCYEEALLRDPDHFPARLALAETLAFDYRYDRSIQMHEHLIEDFPGNAKILVSLARVLGWAKRYDESIQVYQAAQRENPGDPLPLLESARVAVWGKMMNEAAEMYRALYEPSVDRELVARLGAISFETTGPQAASLHETLQKYVEENSIYSGYERFSAELSSISAGLSGENKVAVRDISLELYPVYQIQKKAFLENEAKRLSWNHRLTRSLKTYEELLHFEPGNQEALFDLAQIQCSIGLCDQEEKTYRNLLMLEPHHSLAQLALERRNIRANPFLEGDYSYWREKGRGDLARIARHRSDGWLDIPFFCRNHLRLGVHRWWDKPDHGDATFTSQGHTLEAAGIFNRYIRGEAGWTRRYRNGRSLKNLDTGHARLEVNFDDLLHLGLGYKRTDEFYNLFGIRQGVQANRLFADFRSHPTRKLQLSGRAETIDYTDDNTGKMLSVTAGYQVTDHPRVFKIVFTETYRHTGRENIFVYQGQNLTDIIHPYWTPRRNFSHTLTFEWHHDISKFFFCGGEKHFYDIRLNLGTDSDSNRGAGIEAGWHHEFKDRWTVSLAGSMHRSREWDAVGMQLSIRYRF